MSRIETAFQNDVKLLKLARDELKLQSHLLKAEVKDRWNELEGKWETLDEHMGRAKVAAGDAGNELESRLKELVESMRSGYSQVRDALKRD